MTQANASLSQIVQGIPGAVISFVGTFFDSKSMDTNEPDIQIVDSPEHVEHVSSSLATTSEPSHPTQKKSPNSAAPFSRMRRGNQGRPRPLSHDDDQTLQPSNWESKQDENFCLPGGAQSRVSRENRFKCSTPTLKPPLDPEVQEVRASKTVITGDQIMPPVDRRRPRTRPRTSLNPTSTARKEYNPKILLSDRAKREGTAKVRNSPRLVTNIAAARGRTINIDDDAENDKPPVQPVDVDPPPPPSPPKVPPVRRSARQANINAKRLEQKERPGKALDSTREELEREVKNLTSTEIGYNGPKNLIFMYPPGQRGKIRVTAEERERLKQRKYLNDSLIDFYLKYLEMDLRRRPPPLNFATKFFSSFFFGVLRRVKIDDVNKKRTTMKAPSIDYSGVKNWTRGIDLFATDFVIVPICDSYHWSLIIVANLKFLERTLQQQQTEVKENGKEREIMNDPESPKILYLDSLDPGRGMELAIPMRHYLVEEWLTRKKGYDRENCNRVRTDTIRAFRKAIPLLKPNVPIQNNEYDCGLYVLNSLSMFLDDSGRFMHKMLRGELDMRRAYGSGDIIKLRKNITFLMDLFEEEWNRNHRKSPELPEKQETIKQRDSGKQREKSPLILEEERFTKAASAPDMEIQEDLQTTTKAAPLETSLPSPGELQEVFQNISQGIVCSEDSKEGTIKSPQSHEPPSPCAESLVEHVPEKRDTGVLEEDFQLDTREDVDVDTSSRVVHSVALSEESEDAVMDVDIEDVVSEGDGDADIKQTRKPSRSMEAFGFRTVHNDDHEGDAIMIESNLQDETVAGTKVAHDPDVIVMDAGPEEMDVEARGSPALEVKDTHALKGVSSGGFGGDQRHYVGSSVVRGSNGTPHFRNSSEDEETLDGGNGYDVEEPTKLRRKRRHMLAEDDAQRGQVRPASGYGGGQSGFMDGSQRRRGMGIRRGKGCRKHKKNRRCLDVVIHEEGDISDAAEVATQDLDGNREVVRKSRRPLLLHSYEDDSVGGAEDEDEDVVTIIR